MEFISLCNCPERFLDNTSWGGFQKLIYQSENTNASVGYLPSITSPPTEMKCFLAVINRSLYIIAELKLKYNILKVDQAIYSKIIDATFRTKDDELIIIDKIIPRMGGFHMVSCMLRTMYGGFKDSGS